MFAVDFKLEALQDRQFYWGTIKARIFINLHYGTVQGARKTTPHKLKQWRIWWKLFVYLPQANKIKWHDMKLTHSANLKHQRVKWWKNAFPADILHRNFGYVQKVEWTHKHNELFLLYTVICDISWAQQEAWRGNRVPAMSTLRHKSEYLTSSSPLWQFELKAEAENMRKLCLLEQKSWQISVSNVCSKTNHCLKKIVKNWGNQRT